MNQIIAINSATIGTESRQTAKTSEEMTLFLLNNIVMQSYKSEQQDDLISALNKVKELIPPGYEYLADAVLTHLLWAKECERTFEKHIQDEFFNNIQKYLPGATKVEIKRDRLHIPDGFVEYQGSVLPVEVKRDAIVGASVLQIMRYIKEYGSVGGIVVAPKLNAPLPSNVIFIQVGGAK